MSGVGQLRADRAAGALRPVEIARGVLPYAEGSCEIRMGGTRVLCALTIEEKVPPFLVGANQGWVTAEYSMLPRSTLTRTPREVQRGRPSGRTQEIQRLIGRSLRAVVDLSLVGERTFTVDCDVIQADGGTRCASITGAFVALYQGMARLQDKKQISAWPIRDYVAAVSVGIVQGRVLLDLCYEEDVAAEVDMNVVSTKSGKLVEVQATAEHKTFDLADLQEMLGLAMKANAELFEHQKRALEGL